MTTYLSNGVPPVASALRGERRVATVLMADVKDSTALLERVGSEAWVGIMNRVFQIAGAEIYRFGGEIEQFRGDGLLAFFGVHMTHEDDPERAVMAALGIQDALRRYSDELEATDGVSFLVRVGVNTGEVIVAEVGDLGRHLEFTAMGEAVALAARMEAAAEPGTVLVSRNTFQLIQALFDWEPLGEASVKGLAATVPVYRPLRRRALTRPRGIAGLQSPLVGRQTQFAALQAAVRRVREGKGGIVTVLGEAGIGKSRLVTEMRLRESRNSDQPLVWVEGRSLSQSAGTAYLPWVDLLHRLLRLPGAGSPSDRMATLRARVADLGVPDADAIATVIGRILSVPDAVETPVAPEAASADALKQSGFAAVATVIERITAKRPVVLAFEDLHWADPTSLELLMAMLPLVRATPLLLICISRPLSDAASEGDDGLASFLERVRAAYADVHTDLVLEVLRPRESARLVGNLLASASPQGLPDSVAPAIPDRMANTIVARSGGNPFHLEEIIRALIDGGDLVCDPVSCAWRAAGDGAALTLPGTLRGVLGARIDRLPADARRVLKVAAVCGRFFSLPLLQAVAGPAGLNAAALPDHLAALEAAQMIRQQPDLPGTGYIFKHQLLQETAYASLLRTEVRTLHRLVAEALTGLQGERTPDLARQLAAHWEAAGDLVRAVPYLLQIARHAQAAYANDEAVVGFRHVLTLTSPDPHARPSKAVAAQMLTWRVAALRGLGKVLFATGHTAEAETEFRNAISLAREAASPLPELIRLYHWLGETLFWQGRMTERLALGMEGLGLLDQETPSVELALMNQMVAVGHMVQGDPAGYLRYTERTASFIDQLPYVPELQPAYEHVIGAYLTSKRVADAAALLPKLTAKVDTAHDLLAAAAIKRQWAEIATATGDLDGALAAFEEVIALDTRAGDVKHLVWAMGDAAWTALQMGDLARGDGYLAKMTEQPLDPGGLKRTEYLLHGGLRSGLITGDFHRAYDYGQQLMGHYRAFSSTLAISLAHALIGRIALAAGEMGRAAESFTEALDVYRQNAEAADAPKIQAETMDAPMISVILNGLAEALGGPVDPSRGDAVPTDAWPDGRLGALAHWGLCRVDSPKTDFDVVLRETYVEGPAARLLAMGWRWVDPLGGSRFRIGDGLTITVANGRGLWLANRSAPRLLRAVSGDFGVEVRVGPAAGVDAPSIGGLLIWQSERDYTRLAWGESGPRSVLMTTCLDDRDLALGAGALPEPAGSGGVRLRLERRGAVVSAMCSLDGITWWHVADAPFVSGPVEVGVLALGTIDRTIYRGAFPAGTATRFTDFVLCL